MKRLLKDLATRAGDSPLVRIERTPKIEEDFVGYIVGVSESLVMLHVLCDNLMLLNGYTVLRTTDIRRYQIKDERECFMHRALKLKGIAPVPQPEISLSDHISLLTTADERFPLLTIHQELKYPNMCFIGKVEKLTKKKLTLEEIDPNAQWSRTRSYKLKHITRIDFGDGYAGALDLVSAHEAALKAPVERIARVSESGGR